MHYVIETDIINILHINTCIASCEDGDDGKLILGFKLLNDAIEGIKNNKPTIAIAHHNFDCFNKEEQRKLELLLKEKNILISIPPLTLAAQIVMKKWCASSTTLYNGLGEATLQSTVR